MPQAVLIMANIRHRKLGSIDSRLTHASDCVRVSVRGNVRVVARRVRKISRDLGLYRIMVCRTMV